MSLCSLIGFVFCMSDYTQFLANASALEGAVFGVPWDSFWVYAEDDNLPGLFAAIEAIEAAGGTVLNGTEIPNYKTFISPDGWDWFVSPSTLPQLPQVTNSLFLDRNTGTTAPPAASPTNPNSQSSKSTSTTTSKHTSPSSRTPTSARSKT